LELTVYIVLHPEIVEVSLS